MKSLIGLSILLAVSSGSAVISLNDFVGSYTLQYQSSMFGRDEKEVLCMQHITISQEDSAMSLYADTSYPPIYSGVVNGGPRPRSGSHGEAMTSSKGEDSVKYSSEHLQFIYKGVEKFLGVPVLYESNSYSVSFGEDGDKNYLTAQALDKRTPTKIFGQGKGVHCHYKRR